MGIIRGTVLAGVGAASVLLSACTGGSNQAAPTITPSATPTGGTSTGTASGTPTNQPAVNAPAGTAPQRVDFALVSAIGQDGVVEWVDAKLVPGAEEFSDRVARPAGDKRTAKLADAAVFFSPQGCAGNAGDYAMDAEGLGTVSCSREAYSAMTPPETELYAPAIFFNDRGEIVRMANHYRL